MNSFLTLDWAIVGFYFLILLGIVWWAVRQKQESTTDYFLAGRHVGRIATGAVVISGVLWIPSIAILIMLGMILVYFSRLFFS